MIKKLEQLQNDLAWWQDQLNRSRKESLRSIRAVHVQRLQSEIQELTQSVQAHDLEMLSDMPREDRARK
jgi:uncharacterized coiled-coil DUF342 family protein